MEVPAVFVFTHDSIGVGEDGPTHQPIEQLVSLRSIPGMVVLRPADANEVAESWRTILSHQDQPACIVAHTPGAAHLRPQALCECTGCRARSLCARRCTRGQETAHHPDGDRQ